MMKRKVVWIVSIAIFLLTLGPAGWIAFRYFETKQMACECGDPADGARFAIYNPFRDHGPETAATQLLDSLKAGQCPAKLDLETVCNQFRRNQAISWSITGRTADQKSVVLRIWVNNSHGDGIDNDFPLWLYFDRGDSGWVLIRTSYYF